MKNQNWFQQQIGCYRKHSIQCTRCSMEWRTQHEPMGFWWLVKPQQQCKYGFTINFTHTRSKAANRVT
ncbi:hypothetical protein P8452_30290 [Trifolium repens]|nr:hypothetical protein P8452_30284 [Trifolium repens]WJX43146.1 hypothetical protein P8452_30290 [Trifolium repens]